MDFKTRRALVFLRRFSPRELEEVLREVERVCPQFLSFVRKLQTQSAIWPGEVPL